MMVYIYQVTLISIKILGLRLSLFIHGSNPLLMAIHKNPL